MELYLIGLFLSIRDDRGVFTGISQAIVIILTIILIVIY